MEVSSMEDETVRVKEVYDYRRLDLEERVLKAEEKCIELETELQKSKKELESLKSRLKELESEKLVMEEEFRNQKKREENSLIEQKMENNALEIEKQVADKESKDWKTKFEKPVEVIRKLDELGAFKDGALELDKNVKVGFELAGIKNTEPCKKVYEDALSMKELAYHQIPGSHSITTPVKDYILSRNRDNEPSLRRVNKMLSFEEDCHKSTEVVDLCDDKTEERSEKESADPTLEERSSGENYEDEDVETTGTSLSGRKRKRVITSDSENDDEDADNIPISILLKKMKQPNQEVQDLADTPTPEENMSGRVGTQRRVSSRLKKQRDSKEISASSEQNTTERLVGISTTGNAKDDETDEELESEGESLDGFIVDDDIHETASENSDAILDDESDLPTSYADIMSRLRRDKKPKKMRWEYEADMLADFAKDPELCMKAVCVLYRFQTEDEKMSWSSHVSNGRGFSQFDAIRGTRIGKFLTDGDPQGDLKKSVEELESFEFYGVEICRDLANNYSKQLFQIYNNREDPFFTLPLSP